MEQRADTLLRRHLTPKQRIDYDKYNWFRVVGSHSNDAYYIMVRPYSSVWSDHDHRTFCLVTRGVALPLTDQALLKKLLIETDERRFLATAYS